jgi:hypothetical protein
MSAQDTDIITKISIEDISSHQTESVSISQKPEAEMLPERSNAIKIPLDNIIKK